MNCQDIQHKLAGYLDQELDGSTHSEIDQHLLHCAACRQRVQQQKHAMRLMREVAVPLPMPPGLAQRVRDRLNTQTVSPSWWRRLWLQLTAASIGGALAGATALILLAPTLLGSKDLSDDIVAGHVRSLLANHLADVASTDQHTVKPWFAGRLDFSPPVHDLAAEGFALIGGRLDYLQQRTVAALIYRHKQHIINVYVWPAQGPNAVNPKDGTRNGYQLLAWQQEGMHFYMVSDLNAAELQQLRKLLVARASPV